MHKTLLLLVCFCFIYMRCEDCDQLGVLLYEDLGCKPKNVADTPCPTHFECSNFTQSDKTCLFRSQEIAVGENVNDELIYSSCKIGCRCDLNDRNVTQFNCAVLDCPESAGDDFPGPDCYLTYKLGDCCAAGQRCGPYRSNVKCVVDGNEYKEDEQFHPPDSCLSCVCKKGFQGRFEAPFCKRTVCAVQVDNSDELAGNCAPVYLRETRCCPDTWVCASDSHTIKQVGSKSNSKSNLRCKWGKELLELGEGLETSVEHFGTVKDITCECVLPPLLMCKEMKK